MNLRDIFIFEMLSDSEREDLQLLQHSKELVGADYTSRLPALDKAIKEYGEITSIPLYRGLPEGRGNGTIRGNKLVFSGYASFSESMDVASQFAQETKTIVELTGRHHGFCYYRWIESEFRAMDPSTYESADGDWVIEAAKEESEWILPFASSFRVIGRKVSGPYNIIMVS